MHNRDTRKKEQKKFETIMTENFSKLMSDTKLQTQEAERTPSRVNVNKITALRVILKSEKIKNKKSRKKPKWLGNTYIQKNKDKNTSNFSLEIMQAQRNSEVFPVCVLWPKNYLKDRKCIMEKTHIAYFAFSGIIVFYHLISTTLKTIISYMVFFIVSLKFSIEISIYVEVSDTIS